MRLALREAIIERAVHRAEEGRVPRRMASALARLGPAQWPEKGIRVWTRNDVDHQRIAGWIRQWEADHDSQSHADDESADPEPTPAPEQQALPGFDNPAQGPNEADRSSARRRFASRRAASGSFDGPHDPLAGAALRR